jgi:hypothetical protein
VKNAATVKKLEADNSKLAAGIQTSFLETLMLEDIVGTQGKRTAASLISAKHLGFWDTRPTTRYRRWF